uniref:Uncharacterized protein n=1 Tax=Panagrolaimus sp. ES5 TaxID=591445 RepID=A0AC34FER8_9BILA
MRFFRIDPLFSDTEKKRKFLEITLCQEYTKAAHASIKKFIETLKNFHGIIFIECWLNEDRLTVSLKIIVGELKAPIELMLKNDKVKVSPEEAEDINEQITALIENLLRMDEIFKLPVIFQFSKLIKNEQLPYSASESELAEWLKEYRNDIIKMEYCPN